MTVDVDLDHLAEVFVRCQVSLRGSYSLSPGCTLGKEVAVHSPRLRSGEPHKESVKTE